MSAPLYLHAVIGRLPAERDLATIAVASGRYDEKYRETTDYTSVAVSRRASSVDLALGAGQLALQLSGLDPSDLGLLTFSSIHRHGYPQLWSPAAYLQNELGARSALTFSLNQGCNSQLLACEVAAGLRAGGNQRPALVLGGDVFAGSGFDRWRSDFVAYGDAGSAMLLAAAPGGAKIVSLVSTSRPELERLHRLTGPFDESQADAVALNYDVRATKKRYMDEHGSQGLIETTAAAILDLWQQTQQKTGWCAADVEHLILPNLGRKVLQSSYEPPFGVAAPKVRHRFGLSVGHLGTADGAVGLAELASTQDLPRGSKILVVGAGAGFSWSLLALEIVGPLHAILSEVES